MSKLTTKKITGIAVLTALYCVLSAMMKIPFIGAISLDLGYVALTLACAVFGPWGAFVGAVGCGLESMMFSPYGFSISWFVANLIIGLGCGFVFMNTKTIWKRAIAIILFVGIGMLGAKTGIECYLYHIPFAVKIIKNLVAFGVDSLVMLIGLGVVKPVEDRYLKR
jgi:uncharacterized membrane protein